MNESSSGFEAAIYPKDKEEFFAILVAIKFRAGF